MSAETRNAETLIHPEDLQAELGIKKDAYYEDVKYLKGMGLSIMTRKDEDGRVLLEPESAALIRELRSHISATGKRDGFRAGGLAETTAAMPEAVTARPTATQDYPETLIQRAQALAVQRLVMADLVVAELAEQMTYDDLAPDLQQKVSEVREATRPKANPAEIASQVLHQWRSQRGAAAA